VDEKEPAPASEEPQQGEVLPSMPGGQPYDENGVDITLVQWMLSLTPSERLEVLRQAVEFIESMRHATSGV
jgi:hypothetical protein